jgi:hypothetical protein
MARPPILPLPDAQLSVLLRALPPLLAAHPVGARDHRAFVRDFLRLVHTATARTFSPTTYRTLIDLYTPGRHPSTDTLAQEKRLLNEALAQEADAGRELAASTGHSLGLVVQRAVDTALARHRPARSEEAGPDRYAQAQLDFLQIRLGDTERMLGEVRTRAARLAADLQASQAVRESLQGQLETSHALALQHTQRLAALTNELAEMRKFAMSAIDASRGETRAQKERAVHLEGLLKTEKEHTEVFRRLAYRSGAAIPASIQAEKPA